MIITIDGPSGTGKSTIAKLVGKKLGFTNFNTGAAYRSLTWFLLDRGIDDTNEEEVLNAMPEFRKHFRYDDKNQTYHVGDVDITHELPGPRVRDHVSKVAQHPYVREQMMPIQRDFAKSCKNSIFEGRDIGTVVFPDAELKIYLTASAEVRANRRLKELEEKGESVSYEEVLAAIEERDHRDMTRKIAPLKQAEDAVCIDSSEMTIDEVIDTVCKTFEARNS